MGFVEAAFDSPPQLYQSLFSRFLEDGESDYVIWKPLKWGTAKALYSVNITPEIEERVWEESVVETSFSDSRLEELAGIRSTVVQQVLFFSGVYPLPSVIDNIEANLESARQELANSIFDQMVQFLCSIFAYKPEDVEILPWPTIVKRLAQAERIAQGQMPELPLRLKNPQIKSRGLDLNREIISGRQARPIAASGRNPVEHAQIRNLREKYLKQ